jgi:hypothetical protein
MGLAHDQQYQSVPKIAWSELKDNYRGSWVLIKADGGSGAIRYDGRTYTAVASSGGEVSSLTNDRGGNIVDFLKGKIGKLRSFYVGKDTGKNREKTQKRKQNKADVEAPRVNQDTLVVKFRPLWVKAMNAAVADIKGHIANQIKNDAFEKAKNKLNQLSSLSNAVEELENGSTEAPGFVKGAVSTAIYMAASHYYPETTGEISKRYSSGVSAQYTEGPQQLLKDIANGDTKKLGTVLAFFKRSLISG